MKTMSSQHHYFSPQSTQRAQSSHMISNEYYVPDYNLSPSFITMVLLAYSATTPMSWLIRIIVFPASFNIFIRPRNLFRCPLSCPVVGSSSTIISGSMDNMEATASLCLWPRLSECGSIDEVLLNIKMGAQIKGIITGAGRSRPELVESNMVGQANNIF